LPHQRQAAGGGGVAAAALAAAAARAALFTVPIAFLISTQPCMLDYQ
jgi:hypothetical protein